MGGKDTKHRIWMGEGGEKDRRQIGGGHESRLSYDRKRAYDDELKSK